ncbi:MAG: sigma-54-dependent Fis family transcriptional regulator [Nitrospiraceae bacterium]|nr:MAG: sigma-54-dependent Fis family transcriptional regulator [Nitrospiraceae bacterium]
MKKILIVDDDANQLKLLSRLLHSNKFNVVAAPSGEEALEKIHTSDFDLVLLDQVMQQMSGIDVLVEIKKLKPWMSVIIITGFATVDDAVEATKKGASNYLSKPLDVDKLIVSIRRALEESKFKPLAPTADLDVTFGLLSHQIRRNMITMLRQNNKMHLMEMVRFLRIEDHTKVVFHARILKQAGVVKQDKDKSYFLTARGEKITNCFNLIENDLFS